MSTRNRSRCLVETGADDPRRAELCRGPGVRRGAASGSCCSSGGFSPSARATRGWWMPTRCPARGETFASFPELWKRGLSRSIVISLARVLGGFLLAAAIGVPLGVVAGSYLRVNAFFKPLVIFGRSIPDRRPDPADHGLVRPRRVQQGDVHLPRHRRLCDLRHGQHGATPCPTASSTPPTRSAPTARGKRARASPPSRA